MPEPPRKVTSAPVSQPKTPKPGSIPKLPQTIFNLEKRGAWQGPKKPH
jgi:hypothetical protein